jgi:hypothetical protein
MLVDGKPYHIELDGTVTLIENVNTEKLGSTYNKLNFQDDKNNVTVEKS